MWHADTKTEQTLKRVGMAFEFKTEIPISKLKIEDSLRNNARRDAIDTERVARYAAEMRGGVSFPAIVIVSSGSSYIIMAGNQRTNAALAAGRTVVSAYIVTSCTQEQKDVFIRLDNLSHGKGLSDDEIINTIVELSRKNAKPINHYCNMLMPGNAEAYGKSVVRNQIRTVQDNLGSKGVAYHKLSDAILARLHPVVDINVLRDLAMMAIDYKMTISQINEIVVDIGKKKSEAERKQIVTTTKQQFESAVKGSSPKPKTVGTVFLKTITSFKKFLSVGNEGKKFSSFVTLLSPEELSSAKKEIEDVVSLLKEIERRSGGSK